MKQIIGIILLILGAVGLIIGVVGIFGPNLTSISPWPFAILGLIFFTSGVGLIKRMGAE